LRRKRKGEGERGRADDKEEWWRIMRNGVRIKRKNGG
jgi:hypothetical protein